MNKEIITTIFDKIISNDNNIIIKCKPSEGKRLNEAYDLYAQESGLKIVTNDKSEIHKVYDDDKFDVTIEFTKHFIDENIVDIKNNNKKLINIKDIYTAYENLPDKLKEKINTIRFVKGDNEDEENDVGGWSKFLDDQISDVTGIYIPHYIFHNDKKTLVKSIVEINLTGMTYEEIGIYEKAVDIQDTDPKTYGLKNDDELLDILIRGLNKEFVATIKHVENSFTDFRTYNLFGGLQREN